MSKGLLFWLIYVISILVWGWGRPWVDRGPWLYNGSVVLILIFLLGWQVFGFVVH